MVRVFNEINESHAATGYYGRTDLLGFHVFTLEDTYPSTRNVMSPYVFGFYQIVWLENSADASLNHNTQPVSDLSDSLSFASPQHVLTWVRGAAQRGFILYFKEEFAGPRPLAIQAEFPFFRLTETNLLRVQAADKDGLRDQFERLLVTFQGQHPYRVPILQALLIALLYDCKRLYDREEQTIRQTSPRQVLAFRFQQLVNQQFISCKTVEEYAARLNVSADYLSETVKATTGKAAGNLIRERIVLEAKKLLLYSDLNVGEIAAYLGYAEPTHFGRLFRHYLGVSPLTWRQQQRETQPGN